MCKRQAYVKLRHSKSCCSAVHFKWQKRWHSTSESSALVDIITWQIHAKNHSYYSATASCNHWMWQFQNNVREFYCYSVFSLSETTYPAFGSLIQKMGFISWISPIKYSTPSFATNLNSTKSFGLSGWVVKSTPASQSPSPVNLSDSWVVNSESEVSESVLYSFVTHVWTFFLGLGP